MKKTIDLSECVINTGFAIQIAIGNGKFAYVGVESKAAIIGAKKDWEMQIVKYVGCCIPGNINDRAHDGFPIWINNMAVSDFINQIAKDEECLAFFEKYNLLKEINSLTKEEYKIFLDKINLLGNSLTKKEYKKFSKKIKSAKKSYSVTS